MAARPLFFQGRSLGALVGNTSYSGETGSFEGLSTIYNVPTDPHKPPASPGKRWGKAVLKGGTLWRGWSCAGSHTPELGAAWNTDDPRHLW